MPAGVVTGLEVRAQFTPSVGPRVTRNRTGSAAVRCQLRHPRTKGRIVDETTKRNIFNKSASQNERITVSK